jgi:hypothetical protein
LYQQVLIHEKNFDEGFIFFILLEKLRQVENLVFCEQLKSVLS